MKAFAVCYLITVLHWCEHGLKLNGNSNHCHYEERNNPLPLFFPFHISILLSIEKIVLEMISFEVALLI